MEVFATVNLLTDLPHWIRRDTFYAHFDQADFLNREVLDVASAYLRDWFHRTEDGRLLFYIPVVGVIEGRTDLISSRHRLAVLLPHLEELPFAFATRHLGRESLQVIASIPKRPLDLAKPFWIPDFPVRDKLP